MRKTIRGRTALAMLLVTGIVLAGVLAGCGGDEGSESAATQETTTEESGSISGGDGTASLDGSSITAEFTVTSCTNEGETDLVLEAERDSYTLSVDAPDGTGTIAYTGGNEEDGIDASGTVSSVTVGDAGDFTVEGTWDSDGEAFTLTGNCRL
jgi:hypothetical protein